MQPDKQNLKKYELVAQDKTDPCPFPCFIEERADVLSQTHLFQAKSAKKITAVCNSTDHFYKAIQNCYQIPDAWHKSSYFSAKL